MRNEPKKILVTGGAGFIGSHTCLALVEAGYQVIALDNFCNSSRESLRRVQQLVGASASERLEILEGDIRERIDLEKAFKGGIDAVVHFAGLKSVNESTAMPLTYWDTNVNGSLQLLNTMQERGCRTIVFSSSATTYGTPDKMPITEDVPTNPINPYGHTKATTEQILRDVSKSQVGWRIAILRYFNPAGAHPSGLIGESPHGKPNNIFPLLSQVALGIRSHFEVFGGDWPTFDGTGIRDYIHVMDLAEGHCTTLDTLLNTPPRIITLNLGSGVGYSVLQLIDAFERASGRPIRYLICKRRPGDAAISVADTSRALTSINWKAMRTLSQMCIDSWNWQTRNPSGYQEDGYS